MKRQLLEKIRKEGKVREPDDKEEEEIEDSSDTVVAELELEKLELEKESEEIEEEEEEEGDSGTSMDYDEETGEGSSSFSNRVYDYAVRNLPICFYFYYFIQTQINTVATWPLTFPYKIVIVVVYHNLYSIYNCTTSISES